GLVGERLEESGTDPGLIVFELSERQLRDAGEGSREFALGVSELGCWLALDKFAADGEDRTLLESLPIEFLKIGPSFMRDLLRDPSQRRGGEAGVGGSRRGRPRPHRPRGGGVAAPRL